MDQHYRYYNYIGQYVYIYIYNYIYICIPHPFNSNLHRNHRPMPKKNTQHFTETTNVSPNMSAHRNIQKNIHKHTTTISILGAWGAPASFLVTSQSCSWLELLSSGHLRRGCSSRPPSFTVRADANGFDVGWQPGPQPRHKNPTDWSWILT